ncbi:hypothetical protein [Rariglobus hedericola]|uniref:SLA1 homology domain-containing protein n=1 Tax=Rariglobus hedericola TaxID=2597822 RepID=A0A556QJJ3_9BACT|nr:hypothetical protein [Rariglobus hedericola]TSJ76810.1 hypothetical protein FPL22_11865 [Rariglobus hedericola]
MKPYKLLACLVTLQFTCGFTLQATDTQDFRQWTDVNGRTMSARVVEVPNAESVKIERADGRIFTVPLKTFSTADQSYVKTWVEESADTDGSSLKSADAATWTLLNAGDQPAATYSQTALDQVIENINQRFTVRAVKTPAGKSLQIRTEPSDLASRIQISGDMPRMSVGSFVKEIARINDLGVKTDAAGMVVLVDKSPAPAHAAPVASFFGVPVSQN